MSNIDKRGILEDGIFDYQITKVGKVLLYWHGKHVKTLTGKPAEKFIKKIEQVTDHEAQLMMAKATGNFKRGNERPHKK
ncbi:MAG: hypothetical protein ACPG7F_20545 [Aggregatilineales bacterium]